MKPVNPLFKILALGIAVGLGGGYVWKRQQSAATPPQSVEVKAVEDQQQPKEDSEVMLMESSKSMILDTPVSPLPLIRTPKTLMPGSKSAAMILEPEIPKEQQATPPTVEQRKLLLSGSKSGILIEPEIETQPKPQEQKKP